MLGRRGKLEVLVFEEVATLFLTPAQAEYIGVPIDGPYKPEYYRY